MITALLSILLSLFAIARTDIIAIDAVWYLEASQAYLEQGITAAFQVYFWPFFSLFIAFIHQLTGLSLEYSAYSLNIILAVLLSDAFLRTYQILHNKTDGLWVAALVILSFKSVLVYLGEILKDMGCWSFTLLSLFYFLAYTQERKFVQALAWQLSIIMACLFRLEVISLLLIAPWAVLFFKTDIKTRLTDLFKLYGLLTSSVIISYVFLYITDNHDVNLYRLNHVWHYLDPHYLWSVYHQYIDKVAHQVLTPFSRNYATLILTSGILVTLAIQVPVTLGYVNSAVSCWGIYRFGFPLSAEFRLILLFFGITFLSIIIFFSQSMIMTLRYLILPSLFPLLIVAYYYEKIILGAWQKQQYWIMTVIIVGFGIALIESISSMGRDKYDIHEAGDWVKNNLSTDISLIADDPRLYYYSGQRIDYIRNQSSSLERFIVNSQSLEGYDYALLRFKNNNPRYDTLIQSGQLIKLRTFQNRNGDHSVLFRIQP